MNQFWLIWLAFLIMFLIAPIGYGWAIAVGAHRTRITFNSAARIRRA